MSNPFAYFRRYLARKWTCWRTGHEWTSDLPGPDMCMRCGRLVEF